MLLEVLTRTMPAKRPGMLARNQASLAKQSDPAWVQTLLFDYKGVGVAATHERFARHRPAAQWVWVLDDDDECTYPSLVADLRTIGTAMPAVNVVMVRMDHGAPLGVLPDERTWCRAPIEGALGCSSYIVRGDVWDAHKHAWGSCRYASDFDFIADVWNGGPTIYWLDVIASRCQRGRNMGAAE